MYATLVCLALAVAPEAAIARRTTPADAQALALADLQTLPADVQPFTRYLWVSEGTAEAARTGSLTLNYVSRTALPTRPPLLIRGPLLRVNLQKLAMDDDDLKDYLRLWEEFQYDPSFATLVTKDSLKALLKEAGVLNVGKTKILVPTAPYVLDGETYTERWASVLRLPGRGLDEKTDAELYKRTGSMAAVTELNYFTYRSLSTIKDKGVYETIFGGLYYELSGVRKSKEKGTTDEDLLFEQLGVGDAKKGVKAEVVYERVKSDRRAAMFRSKVTGKPRRVDFLKSLLGRDEAFVFVTHDLADEDIDVGTHPIMNLVTFKDRAREVIYTRRNGLHGFVLFDGEGKLQDAAPDNVVKDHQIPAPHTARLQGAISCIRCHGTDGSDGLKPVTNDVPKLVKSFAKGGVDIFGDLTKLDEGIPQTINRLAGQYAASPDKTLRRGREDYIQAILESTGPWKAGKDQTEVGLLSAKYYEQTWRAYWYATVDTQQALKELGYDVPKEKAQATLQALLPPDLDSRIGDLIPEDPRIAALKQGIDITRTDWALAYQPAAGRIRQLEAKQKKGHQK